MTIKFELDDFSPLNHRFDLLEKLTRRYKDFKVTMFTVPWDIRLEPQKKGTPITDPDYKPWVEATQRAIEGGWLEVAIHGLTHAPSEFHHLTYDEAKKRVLTAQKMFVNVGIKYVPLFKAPYWQLSKDAKQAVEDLNLRVIEDGHYNWNIKDDPTATLLSGSVGDVIAHGHVQNTVGNGLDESFGRLIKIPRETEWQFLSTS